MNSLGGAAPAAYAETGAYCARYACAVVESLKVAIEASAKAMSLSPSFNSNTSVPYKVSANSELEIQLVVKSGSLFLPGSTKDWLVHMFIIALTAEAYKLGGNLHRKERIRSSNSLAFLSRLSRRTMPLEQHTCQCQPTPECRLLD